MCLEKRLNDGKRASVCVCVIQTEGETDRVGLEQRNRERQRGETL